MILRSWLQSSSTGVLDQGLTPTAALNAGHMSKLQDQSIAKG
ncbi:hypothetical protein [Synechococcus sp. M16CYN]